MKMKKLGIALFLSGLVVLAVVFYNIDKKSDMYEYHLNSSLYRDMVDFRIAIANNDRVYDQILSAHILKNQIVQDGVQAEQLYNSTTDMLQIINKYLLMNIDYDVGKSYFAHPSRPLTGTFELEDKMPRMLDRIKMTFERLDYINYALTPELEVRIVQYRELNKRWLNVVGDPESKLIDNQDWPQLIRRLEQETRLFLQEKEASDARELWEDSLNPRDAN